MVIVNLCYLVYEIVVIIVFYKVGRHDETSEWISPPLGNKKNKVSEDTICLAGSISGYNFSCFLLPSFNTLYFTTVGRE